MRRELMRQPELLRLVGLATVPSLATISARSKALSWQTLWQREARRRVVVLEARPLPSLANDAEGRWGKASDGEWFYGYKLYLLLEANTGAVLGLKLATANCNQSPIGRELLKGLPKAKGIGLVDAAYEAAANFRAALARGYHLFTAVNPRRGAAREAPRPLNQRAMQRPEIKALYKKRLDIERVFSIFKDLLALTRLHVHGLKAVERHVLEAVTAFTVLAQALTQQGYSMLQIAQVSA